MDNLGKDFYAECIYCCRPFRLRQDHADREAGARAERQGLRVAVIKHAHHKVVLDTPGKDSFRYKEAGAAMSILLTRDALQLVVDATEQREPEQIAQRFLGEADLVLAEGFSHAAGVKIEVLRRACSSVPRCSIGDGLIAIVTDIEEVYPELPHFALEDVKGIVEFILQRVTG